MTPSLFVRLGLLLLALLCCAAPTIEPAQAQTLAARQPSQLSFFGLNTYITGQERLDQDGENGIKHLIGEGRAAGTAWAREEISWGNLEPQRKGFWNWKNMDKRIAQLADSGYGILGMLLTTPEWARVPDCRERARNARTERYWCPPANLRDWTDFVWTVVERYDGDGMFDAPGSPRIAVWQIWNEPSAPITWPGSAAEYGRLLVEGYKAAKAADPTALVATGGVYVFDGMGTDPTDGLHFYNAMIREVPESLHTFDALAIHPWMTNAAPDGPGMFSTITVWGRILNAQRWLREHPGIPGVRPLWITELGWSFCRCGDARCPAYTTRNEQDPATFLVRAHAIALALGVQHFSYFQLEDKFDGGKDKFCDDAAGLVDIRLHDYRRKPTFTAYRTLTQQLGGATFVEFGPAHTYRFDPTDQNYAGLYHLRFRKPDNTRVDVLWRTVGSQDLTIALEARFTADLITWDGTATRLNGRSARLSIGETPIYIIQRPAR